MYFTAWLARCTVYGDLWASPASLHGPMTHSAYTSYPSYLLLDQDGAGQETGGRQNKGAGCITIKLEMGHKKGETM